jgi:hypothetical protein
MKFMSLECTKLALFVIGYILFFSYVFSFVFGMKKMSQEKTSLWTCAKPEMVIDIVLIPPKLAGCFLFSPLGE